MEDIKENEYVRTYLGEIGRVIAIKENPDRVVIDDCGQIVLIADITKHSFNLIDLLEVGDILEIELSEEFVERKDKKVFTRIGDVYTKEALQKDMDNGIIQEIKQILTHEQFESNAYKVKGE